MARARPQPAAAAWLSIGALSRATGVAVETLRTWESRYGFPVPERKPSGHRLYPLSAVPRLRRIAQALSLGHRAGQVVAASEAALAQLLAAAPAAAGCRGLYLGTDVPVAEIRPLVRDLAARAVAVSVSRAARGLASTSLLRRLRAVLPRRVRLVVGGEGAPAARPGIDVVTSLHELDAWGRRLALVAPLAALTRPTG